MTLFYIIISISLVSILSLVGIFTFFIKKQSQLDKVLFMMVSFAVGSLLGAAFLDILPEAFEATGSGSLIFVVFGIMLFFIVEKFLFWRHCHKGECMVHTFNYMNLLGGAIHNFIDGMIIATAFIAGASLGIITTIAIILHEIPQELGDFGILCYGGFSRTKALLCNFLTVLTAFLGAFFVYIFSAQLKDFTGNMLGFAAGGFIYIACTDLMPELGKEPSMKRSLVQFTLIFFGISVIWFAKTLFK